MTLLSLVKREVYWDGLLSLLEDVGDVTVELPDGPTLDGSKFPGEFKFSRYFYSTWEISPDLLHKKWPPLSAIFKHAIRIQLRGDSCDIRTPERTLQLKKYFDSVEAKQGEVKPVTSLFLYHGNGKVSVFFTQIYPQLHSPQFEASKIKLESGLELFLPPADSIGIYKPNEVEKFFGCLERSVQNRGYKAIPALHRMKVYIKPHPNGGLQLPMLPRHVPVFLTVIEEGSSRGLSVPTGFQLPLLPGYAAVTPSKEAGQSEGSCVYSSRSYSPVLAVLARGRGFGNRPGYEPEVNATGMALRMIPKLGGTLKEVIGAKA